MQRQQARFSAEEAVSVQRALRSSLGQGPEAFPMPAFIGMISDEIEQFRASGRSDTDIAAVIKDVTGREVDPADIARFYAHPQDRHGHGSARDAAPNTIIK